MQAVRLHAYHEWPSLDSVPDPEITGPWDVIVKIGGAGLCRTDLHIYEGQWAPKTGIELPYTIGHENAGWVHEVGTAVTNVEVGDAVIVHPLITCGLCRACRDGDDMHCDTQAFPGVDTDGGWAELLKTSARSVVKLPAGVEPADVAAHADAGLTAYHAVKKAVMRGELLPGTMAVVIGAGGLGHIGIQSLKALCAAEVIVVDRSPEALELAKAVGADHLVEADGSHVERVQEMTGGGAHAVFDFVGENGVVQQGFDMTRRAASHYVIGYGENIDVPTIDVISSERSFVGNLVGTYNDLAELMVLAAQQRVTLHTRTFPLSDAVEAMQELHHGRLQGRGILVP
jgi:NAD+-dependent secondary alcohol dehydrogenase Adh1